MISTDTPANVTPGLWAAHRWLSRKPGWTTAVWASGYLVLSGAVLAVTGHAWTAVLHLLMLIVLTWAAVSDGKAAQRVFALLPPVLVIALAYGEVATLVAALGMPFHDAAIQRLDNAIFGMEPARDFASRASNVCFSELLHAGYLSYYLALSVPPLLLYVRGQQDAFEETILTLVTTWLVACALFVAFPVAGPRFLWGSPPSMPDGLFRRLTMSILAAGSVRGTAFPSLHMAASLSQTVMAWRWQAMWLRVFMTVSTILIGVGAVYAGYHYAVDMIAGGMLGTVVVGVIITRRRHTLHRKNAA